MRKILIALLFVLLPLAAVASESNVELMDANVDVADTASLQRGAQMFANFCMGCHSLKYMRYSQLAEGIGADPKLVEKYIAPPTAKIHDQMTIALDPTKAKGWFGVAPPDLSTEVRLRGADWVYTYLNTFYKDDSRPFGVNNLVFPKVGMPHVLWQLQGVPQPEYEDVKEGNGKDRLVVSGVKVPEKGGRLTPEQYRQATHDLVNFLAFVAKPYQLESRHLGIYVIIFLLFFLGVAYLLKKEYWKDVH